MNEAEGSFEKGDVVFKKIHLEVIIFHSERFLHSASLGFGQVSASVGMTKLFGDRLTVGQQPLKLCILVRVQVPEL